jgi:hypothetical protein
MQDRNPLGRCRLLCTAAVFLLLPASGRAQDTPLQLRVRVEDSSERLPPINLRPNTTTAVQFFLQNPTADDSRNFSVKLVQLVGDQVRVVAQADVAKLLPREEIRLAFAAMAKDIPVKSKEGADKGKDAADKGKDAADKGKDAADKVELAGPPFKMQLWIEPKLKGDFPPIKRDIDVLIREPRDYLTTRARYDAAMAKLSFRVTLDGREPLIGPPQCPVELVLGPQLAPTKTGTFKQIVIGPKATVELHAADVAFVGPGIREGFVALTVDGYERAFVYPVSLRGSGELSEVDFGKKVGVRVLVPAYGRPAAKFPVRLELDGPVDGDYRVEVALDRAGTREQFGQVVARSGLRHQRARIGVSASGDLSCQTEVRDWQVEFDTTGVFGKMWLRIAVFKKGRQPNQYDEVELVPAARVGPDASLLEVDAESKRIFARVVQDDSKAEGIEFVDLPKEWPINKPLPLKIRVGLRGAEQAPADAVMLLRGKVPADGKISPEAILGTPSFDPKLGLWQATLGPQEKVEPLEFSVQVTTRSGVVASKTVIVAFRDPTAGGKGIAKIVGKISYGTNPVPNAAVVLTDEKGMVKGSTKSGAEGDYAFEKVPPGIYVISAAQSFPALVGQAKVQVPEGVELVDNVAVRLLSK